EGNDEGFAAQKARIRSRLQSVASTMRIRREPAGFVHVQMREDAFGKSYRPIGSLFTDRHGFGLVGAGRIGEMIFQVTPQAMEELDQLVEERAELTVRQVRSARSGEIEKRVSGYRSEVGAIAEVNLHDSADRIGFSADDALAWLQQPNTIGGYLVELFRPVSGQAPQAIRHLVSEFRRALERLPTGVRARPFLPSQHAQLFGEPILALSIQLVRDADRKDITLPFLTTGEPMTAVTERPSHTLAEPDLRASSHQALLGMLSEQTLVRSVELPPLVEAA